MVKVRHRIVEKRIYQTQEYIFMLICIFISASILFLPVFMVLYEYMNPANFHDHTVIILSFSLFYIVCMDILGYYMKSEYLEKYNKPKIKQIVEHVIIK